ncbi:MAG: glycosyltransferase family 4 protein [Bacteroidales bacterium]|nr:glycosyltransferase family 4 protein [Bacteroidales bacterium]
MDILLICNYRPGVGGISGQVEILQRKLREEGHRTDIFSTKGSVFQRLLLPAKLRKAGRRYALFHIHCCSGWGFLPAVVGVGVGRRLGKRTVLTYHGGGGEKFFERNPKLVRHFLLRTDRNIVLSGFLARVFDRFQLPYTVIPNIVELDPTLFRRRERLEAKYICTRAHEELYNIPCILRAFRQVQQRLPDAALTLVGTGSQHQQLKQLSSELGLRNVTFTGRVDNNEIYRHLDQSDILLSAPRVDNMPVSLLEAMNAGLLVISSAVGGVPYIIDDNRTGLLFGSDDSDQLAAKMLQAVEQQEESLAMVQEAHRAVNAYQWENVKEKLYTAYGIHP